MNLKPELSKPSLKNKGLPENYHRGILSAGVWLLFSLSLWFYPGIDWGTESMNRYRWQAS